MHKQKQQAGEQGEKHTEEREARKLRKKKGTIHSSQVRQSQSFLCTNDICGFSNK